MTKFEDYVSILKRYIQNYKNKILFVCIGTNKVLADSIGPLVGSYLKQNLQPKMVLGDCNNNMCNKFDMIYNYPKIRNKYIVAIDSAISEKNLMGEIFITKKPIEMGSSQKNIKGKIGDIGIKIAISNFENVNQNFINNRAKFVANGIIKAMK